MLKIFDRLNTNDNQYVQPNNLDNGKPVVSK